MDRWVVFLRKEKAQDAYGAESDDWKPLLACWGAKIPVSGREGFASLQRFAEVTERFRVDFDEQVTPVLRLTCEGRAYDILEVLEVGRREGMEVLAKARAA